METHKLLIEVANMRKLQVSYFKTRNKAILIKVKAKERLIDKELNNYFNRALFRIN